ncbi:uncharacterized protein LOC125208861 isoform X1 [Salvia hispanica]|uniref:uncharacterized protein LOC125208861 isoform X1 n=1 Tax=Salvia hispanica TaxID=49212 RepID=UPI0020098A49|nr:uncharacterized protein LOC125208861 isoform X1 [Salvia hispanica]
MVKRACTSHNDHRGVLVAAYSFLRRFCRSWSKPTCLEKYIKLVVSRPLLKQMIIHFIGSNRARISGGCIHNTNTDACSQEARMIIIVINHMEMNRFHSHYYFSTYKKGRLIISGILKFSTCHCSHTILCT